MKKSNEENYDQKLDINKLLETTRKSFPKAVITKGNDPSLAVKTIPSGIWMLDNALKGGFRRGSLSEICGQFSTGKTWLICHTIKQAQDLGFTCGLIDTEHRYDPEWAKNKLGINIDELYYARPSCGEEGFSIINQLIEEGIDLIGIDSFASFIPLQFVERTEFTPTMGVKAKMMSEGLEKMLSINKNTAILAANQLRADIGNRFNPGILSKMVGGSRQYFDAALIVEVRRKGWIKDSGDSSEDDDEGKIQKRIGFIMECLIKKVNYSPTVEQTVRINYNFETSQVDNILSIIDAAIERGIIKKGGSWFQFGEERIQGRQGMRNYFQENKDKFEELKKRVFNE